MIASSTSPSCRKYPLPEKVQEFRSCHGNSLEDHKEEAENIQHTSYSIQSRIQSEGSRVQELSAKLINAIGYGIWELKSVEMGLKWRWWGRHGWPGRGDTGKKLNCVACSVRDSCSFFDPQLFRTGETTKRSRKCTLPAPPQTKEQFFRCHISMTLPAKTGDFGTCCCWLLGPMYDDHPRKFHLAIVP